MDDRHTWTDQEREARDYEAGLDRCSEQTALAYSRMAYQKRGDDDLVKKLKDLGFYIVAHEFEVFCPATDAFMHMEIFCLAAFTDESEAQCFADHHEAFVMGGPAPEPVEEEPLNEDDIPF